MKKIFTFAAALLASLSMMAASYLPEETLFVESDMVVFGKYFAHLSNGATANNWAVDQSVGYKTDKSFVAVDEYVPSSQSGDTTLTLKGSPINPYTISSTGRTLHMRVSNAKSVTVYGIASSDNRGFKIHVARANAITTEDFELPLAKDSILAKKNSFALTIDTLDYNQEYVISVRASTGTSDSEVYLYAVRFEAGSATPAKKYTVSYMDNLTVLGTETVKEGETAKNASQYEAKPHATFNGWYNEATFTTAADFTAAINADKAFYGKWTAEAFVESSSLNIEQGVLDYGKGWDIAGALTAAKIAYKNIDALDSLNSAKGDNNEPYLGLKLKTAGAYVEMGVGAGHILEVKFGHVDADVKINGNVIAKSELAAPYRYTATADEYVRVETTTGGTVVLKQINILTELVASADLSAIKINGTAIAGFHADTLNYTYTLPYGTISNPTIEAIAVDPNAIVAIDPITSLTQKVNIVVTSGTLTKTYSVQLAIADAPKDLYEAVFSNGAKASIYGDVVEVAYMGTKPTLVSDSVSEGATATVEGDVLTITGADKSTRALNITFVELTAPAFSADTTTFNGEETYIYGHYGWDETKGWKFAKAVNEAGNMRITEGKTRIYMALPACESVYLISGSGANRAVKIYVNGVQSSVEKTAASGAAVKITLDKTQANFVAIESNQTGGDGGFIKMVLDNGGTTGLWNNNAATKAVKVVENGQIVIIKNGVRYNAVGAKL